MEEKYMLAILGGTPIRKNKLYYGKQTIDKLVARIINS